MPAIGIDLGTTYSCVGVWQFGKIEIIANEHGNRTTPSYVAFNETERLVGEAAKRQIAMNPSNTIFDVKRLIGRRFDDPIVQADMKNWPFKLFDENSKPKIQVDYQEKPRQFFPEEVSSMVLSKMKYVAETYLGTAVKDAVITVPAYFNDSQRQATKDAGHIAGLNVLRIISEPTAAALAYGLDKNISEEKNVLIFDLGGGTFDVSILKISEMGKFETLSAAGDTHLGGVDFDNRLVDYLKNEFENKFNLCLSDKPRALGRLRIAAEQAKRALSSMTMTSVEAEALCSGVDLYTKVSRARFEDLCLDLFESLLAPVTDAIEEARLKKEDIDEVILVGGSTRIPRIRSLLQNYFDGKQLNCSVHPDEAVAYGAAVQAAKLGGDIVNSAIEAVTLLDVTPLSLGISLVGDIMSIIIPRNSRIPCERTVASYTTEKDNQTNFGISVYEGERLKASGNNLLGKFILFGVPSAPKGQMKLSVTFKLNEDGILNVSAVCPNNGSTTGITVKNETGRLSKETIDKMMVDAARFKLEDELHRDRMEARKLLEDYAFKIKHAIANATDKIPSASKTAFHDARMEVMNWLTENPNAQKEQFEGCFKKLYNLCSEFVEK